MEAIQVVYMSISGHVRSFIDRLTNYADEQVQQKPNQYRQIQAEEIVNEDDVRELDHSFVMFVPTYISLSPKDHQTYFENSTLPLRKLLNCGNNARLCRGIVGNGDRFFGPSYCYTSRQYAKMFHVPLLGTFESRGTCQDIEKIYQKIIKQYPVNNSNQLNSSEMVL